VTVVAAITITTITMAAITITTRDIMIGGGKEGTAINRRL
jgi:hypothetical protein